MAITSRQTSKVIEDLRANMQSISKKCQQIIKDEDGNVNTNTCIHVDGDKCKVYAFPDAKWRLGNCIMATHVETESEKKQGAKKRVGQQKQKKKAG